MGFRLRDHTADVAVEATADDVEGLFAAVADGLTAAACDDVPEPGSDAPAFELSVTAESREAVLFDYLDRLIYERDVRSVLPVRNRVAIEPPGGDVDGTRGDDDTADPGSAWRLDATARGVPLAAVDAREIKAVTYSEMRVEPTDDGWTAYVVFDV
ncbi:archease [Halobellus ruber]|uniref:Archease n=1 Tax=Halobellus ruber TaxID=2761102 RepID=A0A7J9SLY9_9EURY|nr:archease [Halobellus ruber]MBB6647935.1 archease [Halobellus ruber]